MPNQTWKFAHFVRTSSLGSSKARPPQAYAVRTQRRGRTATWIILLECTDSQQGNIYTDSQGVYGVPEPPLQPVRSLVLPQKVFSTDALPYAHHRSCDLDDSIVQLVQDFIWHPITGSPVQLVFQVLLLLGACSTTERFDDILEDGY